MTVQEAARQLEVSVHLVYRLCSAGRLAHTRIGLKRGVIRIDPADLAEFRAARKVEACDEPDEAPEVIRLPRARAGAPKPRDYIAEHRAKG